MSRLPSSSSGGGKRDRDSKPLPKTISAIKDLLDELPRPGSLVNIIGVVKDYMLPVPTKTKDYKATLTLFDVSTDDENDGIKLNVFRSEAEMLNVDAGDIVVVFAAKYQQWGGSPSLITNYQTSIHVYDVQKIPNSKHSVREALKEPTRKVKREPNVDEHEYVEWLFGKIDKGDVPDRDKFQLRARQSLNIKEKFSLLKDIKVNDAGSPFLDLIVQVVRDPYDMGDKITLWVSDYTENPALFNRTVNLDDGTEPWAEREGDPYGYTTKFNANTSNVTAEEQKWVGPYGKRSLQVTCWEPHADFIRSEVRAGQWVRLRNVHIGFGHNGSNIEGFVREDRRFPTKINVDLLDPQAGREGMNDRFLDVLRRKRDYEKEKKQQLRGMKSNLIGAKRKRDEPVAQEDVEEPEKKPKSKGRRRQLRAAMFKEVEEKEVQKEAELGLNELVKCENPDKEFTSLSSILEPVYYETTIKGEQVKIELPFTCAKYRTYARVVDFHPANLQDFAVSRKVNDYDCLSAGSEPSDSESEDEDPATLDRFAGRRIWEWRFSLKLEEISSARGAKKNRATAWVVVDNAAAQCLTGLDASELRRHVVNLNILRERMFTLWGDLEERKTALEAKKRELAKSLGKKGYGLPPDSSDAEDGRSGSKSWDAPLSETSNKPFSCCICQYGIKENVCSSEKATAGEGMKWQRMFGLFGTKISSE